MSNLSFPLIIAGFSGIGKTTLAAKYKNVIDLDAATYVYTDIGLEHLSLEERKGLKRPSNPNWPMNYIEAIQSAIKRYDIILVWDRPDIVNMYLSHHIPFLLCYPSRDSLREYYDRFISRGNSKSYANMKMDQYETRLSFYQQLPVDKIILGSKETLEDYLKNHDILLTPWT